MATAPVHGSRHKEDFCNQKFVFSNLSWQHIIYTQLWFLTQSCFVPLLSLNWTLHYLLKPQSRRPGAGVGGDSEAESQGSNPETLMCKDGQWDGPGGSGSEPEVTRLSSLSEPHQLGLGVGWYILLGHSLTNLEVRNSFPGFHAGSLYK